MSSVGYDLLFIVLLILANGLFAMSEMALISARKARLEREATFGIRGARIALELANAPANFLSTVQVGITLVGILAGAFGGATVAEKISEKLKGIPWTAPYSQAIGIGVVVVGIAYLSLIIGELVPKRLALNHAERIAIVVSRPMQFLSKVASPVVRLLNVSTDLVLRLLGIRPSAEPPVTEEEVKILIDQGTRAGVFEQAEKEIVDRVFRLSDQRVGALMTPRTDIVWLDVNDTTENIIREVTTSGYSRFPVGQDSLDNVLGTVRTKDLLAQYVAGQQLDLKGALRPPLFAPETMRAMKMLESFKVSARHIALVIDEYGGVQGLVTHHNVLEAIVGDIALVTNPAERQAVQREDGSWLIDGMLTLDEFKPIFQLTQLPGEEQGDYHTMGGFVMSQIGRIPVEGDHFEIGGLRFEVVDMDERRVDKLLVARVGPETPDSQE
jgi:magnesium and cobalt exporter, CNNM family